ncbi:MAG TPA: SGNH/GDSL hydrolase family protein [Chitinophagales bacterium]|nr:SGNH/GDSL hydrolase family protein [Chitinophagales bacterium]
MNFFSEPNWIATIIVYISIVYIFYKILKKLFSKYSWYPKLLAILKYLVYCLLLIEFGLRIIGINQTHIERKSGKYESLYKFRPDKIIHKRTPNESFNLKSNGEFDFLFKTNSWGYSDGEWDTSNKKNLNILALGDSFTEGVGATQDSSWVAQISKKYSKRNIRWYNGGISASDPFTNFYNLQHELYQLKPDIVVQVLSNQDFDEDLLLRGGYERFKNNQLKYQKAPYFEYVYAYSYIVRLLRNLITKKEYYISLENLKNNQSTYYFEQLVYLYNDWAQKNQTQVILVHYSTDYNYYNVGNLSKIDSSRKVSDYLKIESVTSCYQESILNDLDSFKSLWWKIDHHHTAQGYRLMSNCIYDLIQPTVDSTYEVKFHQ